MKRIIAFLFLPLSAFAQQDFPQDIQVCWDNTDSYIDGTLIESGDLESVRIEIYRQNDDIPTFTATVPASGEGLNQCEAFTGAVPQPGTYRVEGYSIVIGGIESDPSESLFKKYVGKPRAVTLISVE